ncbi:zinc finger protein RFP-like [Sceloporus undulatus]|uniref:zinc finger protein RFP-like n=1 Tax=Sceloporus undulatus TaxID=8520 RepID=UPI001C4B27F1|nr:zinc finger protein RFP-like [Sceloporus undulatus]
MAAVAEGAVQDLCEEATCSICLDYFRDPVTIACGHNFCHGCLAQCWEESVGEASCPHCRMTVQPGNVIPNRPLANFVEITKKLRLQAPGGAGGEGRVCGEHQEPLKLFCKDDETPICVVCDRSKEHRNHDVVPVEEAAQEYKDQIYGCLENLREKREQILASKAVAEKESEDLLKETEAEREKTVYQFRQLHQFLEDQEEFLLAQIEEGEKEIILKKEEYLATLSRQFSFLESLIQEMEEKCRQPDSEFLQDIRKTLKKIEKRGNLCIGLFVPLALKWTFYDIKPSLEYVMKQFQDLFPENKTMEEEVEYTGELYTESTSIGYQPKISGAWEDVLLSGAKKVNITLAPDTAFPRLILSEDLKSVRWDKKYQAVPKHPDRFNQCPFVLGRQEFSAGRYYWDVYVENQEEWAVGVARKSVLRKGPVMVSPECGIWAVGKSSGRYQAFIPPHNPLLCLNWKLKKIRVFLNYGKGELSFYNVDTKYHLYTLSGVSSTGEILLPFFRVFKGGFLSISP